MAITFPRDLPLGARMRSGGLTLERQVTMAPTRGGLQQVAELGTPIWRARYATPSLREKDVILYQAWLESLRGGTRAFKAIDTLRRYAMSYPAGYGSLLRWDSSPFDGTGLLASVNTSGYESLQISNLPAAFAVLPGDLVSFANAGGRQSLHRVTEPATATVGGLLTISCEPVILPGYTIGAVVALASPWFKAVLDTKSVRFDWQPGRRGTLAFEAWQTYA